MSDGDGNAADPIWRTGRIAPPKIAPAAWWRHRSALLPPRIGVLVGMLALLCGGLLAAAEYAEHRAELRLAETNRLLEEFRSGPVADAWARLRAAWRAEQNRQNALLARMASLRDPTSRGPCATTKCSCSRPSRSTGCRTRSGWCISFLIRLAICVRAGSCDPDVAAAQLGPALWTFRDQHRYYFGFEYSGTISTRSSRSSRRARPGRRSRGVSAGEGRPRAKPPYITMMAWADAFGANGGRFRPEW